MGKVKRVVKKGDTRNPGGKESLLREADEALSVFDYEKACARFEAALNLDGQDTETMDKLGEVCVTYLGDDDKGMAVLKRSIELAPNDGHTKYMTVGQMIGGGEGLQYFKKGAENLAAALQKPGASPEDVSEMKDAMAQCFCAVAELWTTDLCMEDGAEHQCKAALDFAKQYNPNNVELHYLYAQLHLRLNDMDSSKASLQHVLKLLEYLDDERHPSTDIKIEIGKLLMQVSEWDEAYHFLKSLLIEDDGNGYLYYLMGETLKHLGNFRRAMRHLLRAKSIAGRIAQNSPADDGDEEGPHAFLAQVDTLLQEISQKVDAREQQAIMQRGESGFMTDSEDEDERRDAAQGEEFLRQALGKK
eukprot:TRINITY_DN8211_c0_g1_i2.p1 TRINITY_DN8211_c0_g1~~TRINITY_DN8211_c0_g1_i2.p1  ORF type:complete len:372 (+),score=170.57 TRINITY_DN8211_c0_g1_i2:38-1117(+)